jgi:DNA repair protein RadC
MELDYKVAEVELSYKPTQEKRCKVIMAEDAYDILLPTFKDGTIDYKEYFKVLFLNQASEVVGYTTISEGGITETSVDVRIIMQGALLTNATNIIIAHNHPSGNLQPSMIDKKITKEIAEACKIMRINLIDHIIMTSKSYFSFIGEGLL